MSLHSFSSILNKMHIRNTGAIIIDGLRFDFINKSFASCGHKKSLLDLGCGVKPYEFIYKKYAEKHVGIDVATTPHSQDAVDKIYNGKDIPFEDKNFDIVFSTEVLEHVPEPQALLQEISRVLKKNGVIIMTVPFLVPLHEEPYDFYRYTKHGLKHLLNNSGFEISHIESLGGYTCVLITLLVQVQLKIWNKLANIFRLRIIYSSFNPFIFIFTLLPQYIYLLLVRSPIGNILNGFIKNTPKGYGIIAIKR